MDGRTARLFSGNAFRLAAAREAIAALGLVVPEAEGIIWHMLDFRLTDHPKARTTAYRKDGEQLSSDEKRALGLRSSVFLSQRAFTEISSKGMAAPLEAHEKTLLRASFSMLRYRATQNLPDIQGYEIAYKIEVVNTACSICKLLDGNIVSIDAAPMFAVPGCDCETANFGLRLYIDWLAGVD